MPDDGPPWPWQALIHPKSLAFLSGRFCPNCRMDECQQALFLHFLLGDHLSFVIGSPSRKTKCPWLPPALVWAPTVGVQAISLALKPDGRGPQFLLWRSSTLQA